MIKDRLREFKKLLQLSLNQKSIKVYGDGRIIVTCRYKPEENLVNSNTTNKLEEMALAKVKAITNLKYRITSVQKQPNFCYNTYTRILSISSASSQDRMKRFLKYFKEVGCGRFELMSYCEVVVVLQVSDREGFSEFLFGKDGDEEKFK